MLARTLFVGAAVAVVAVVMLAPSMATLSDIGLAPPEPSATEPIRSVPTTPANLVAQAAGPGASAADGAVAIANAFADVSGPYAALDVVSSARAKAMARQAVAASEAGPLVEELDAIQTEMGVTSSADERAIWVADVNALPAEFQVGLADLVHAIRVGAALADSAFADLSAKESKALDAAMARHVEALEDPHMASSEKNARAASFEALASRVDQVRLQASSLVVSQAVDRFVDTVLAPQPSPQWAGGDLLASIGGIIHIGGTGTTTYGGFNVLVIDLGGDDEYEDTAGGVGPGSPYPVSVVIDVQGNDRYHGTFGGTTYGHEFVQGAGYRGVGLLVDLLGDDQYSSFISLHAPTGDANYTMLRSQGFGMLGAGVLMDVSGNDVYNSFIELQTEEGNTNYEVSLVQGAAQFGVGILANGFGEDRYNSDNFLNANRGITDAYSTWTARFCQGAALTPGIGILLEGTGAPEKVYVAAQSPFAGSDRYNSGNNLRALGGTGAGGFGGDVNQFSLVCQGATAAGEPAPLSDAVAGIRGVEVSDLTAVAVGILIDGLGDDLYNSDNVLHAEGWNNGGRSPYCRSCHVGAKLSAQVNQGASGGSEVPIPGRLESKEPGFPPQRSAGVMQVGVLVDALGNDRYNSGNDLTAVGYIFPLIPATTDAFSIFEARVVQGATGTSVLTGEPPREGVGDDGEPAPPANPCMRLPSTVIEIPGGPGTISPDIGDILGTVVLPGLGEGVDVKAGIPCRMGIMVDAHGEDQYNSHNSLAAYDADDNWEEYWVTNALGSGEQGIGVFVDGVLGNVVEGTIDIRCGRLALCQRYLPPGVGTQDLGTANDRYNSFNTAPESRSFVIEESIGYSYDGIGAFVDVGIATDSRVKGSIGDDPAAWTFSTQLSGMANDDIYNSGNVCTDFVSQWNYAGAAGFGIAASLDIIGDDIRDQNKACRNFGWATTNYAFGYGPGSSTLALFGDVQGRDTYPTVWPVPSSILAGGAPTDDDIWLSGGLLLPSGGFDLLSTIP